MEYIKQVIFDLRHQKMMMWVSVSGTALAIFLVMAFFMSNRMRSVAVAPETDRDHIVFGQNIDVFYTSESGDESSQSSPLGFDRAKKLYEGLDGVELYSYFTQWPDAFDVGKDPASSRQMTGKYTDGNYWKMYHFNFVEGKPFGDSSYESGEKVAVISQSVARDQFSGQNAMGRDIWINGSPVRVVGVVEDVNPMLEAAYSDVWMPLGPEQRITSEKGTGVVQVAMLMKPGTSVEDLKREVSGRYDKLNTELKALGQRMLYHGQPYTIDIVSAHNYGSNTTPDPNEGKALRYIIYLLLLILPAINLSSMTRSRLRHRESEIGLRRAFGASKISIMNQLLGENLIITLLGGLIGLACSILFMFLMSRLFMEQGMNYESVFVDPIGRNPDFSMLFTWSGFLMALAFCFILNLLSAFVPSWKAARVQPADAISKR